MHEGVYTDQIAEAVQAQLAAHPGAKPLKVRVKVGEMLHLQPDAVRMHFSALAAGTPLAGLELDLEEAPVELGCRACGKHSHPEDHHLLACAACGSRDVEVLEGRSVVIERIDLVEGD
jgi:hydrogenase nickel incorporation protein HypA/HybF